jgi:hypothetical protein
MGLLHDCYVSGLHCACFKSLIVGNVACLLLVIALLLYSPPAAQYAAPALLGRSAPHIVKLSCIEDQCPRYRTQP